MGVVRAFVDTNPFFYAVDARDAEKQRQARALLIDLANSGGSVVSTHVIQEFANNAIKKLEFTPEETIGLCEAFADYSVVKPDLDMIGAALRLMKSATLSFWDACIVAAAQKGQCKVLYTEDLWPGQRYGSVLVSNPFS